jgi:hypothetical protein
MSDSIFIQVNNEKIEATGEELELVLKYQAEAQADRLAFETELEAKKTARASALAKLADVGLTEEEIAAL